MNKLAKKAYRYDLLAELTTILEEKIRFLSDDINRYKEDDDPTDWQRNEIEVNSERINVITDLIKEMEKM